MDRLVLDLYGILERGISDLTKYNIFNNELKDPGSLNQLLI